MKDSIVYCLDEKVNNNFSVTLENKIKSDNEKSDYLLNYPTVYIHDYKNRYGKHEVYVGESNNVVLRTINHYNDRKIESKWQHNFLENDRNLKMYIIGNNHFNKSLTLDIENKLIHLLTASTTVEDTCNSRCNPQSKYYPCEEFDDIFLDIWKKLHKIDDSLFLPITELQDSAIFKASPFHKLTDEQLCAKKHIINKVYEALNKDEDSQLIFVEGEAGTGKTVLNSNIFYDLITTNDFDDEKPITCCLMVNHDEQMVVYEEIAKKLNLRNRNGKPCVMKPTPFINHTNIDQKVDVAFIDEGHLLLTRGKQSYQGNNQLKDIIERAKVTIVMFDENQILTAEEVWEQYQINEMRNLSKKQNNYIDDLKTQIRIRASKTTIDWIDAITKDQNIISFIKDDNYDLRVFDNPTDLFEAIKEKSENDKTKLSRLIASYDWNYSPKNEPENEETWNVTINDFSLPWNREKYRKMNKQEKKKVEGLAWAEQPQTIDEVGSTYTIQGFDLNYAGVIIGPSVGYENGKIVFHPDKSCNTKAKSGKTLSNGKMAYFAETLLKHELRVLMTRGVNGMYIYACDPELNKALKESINNNINR